MNLLSLGTIGIDEIETPSSKRTNLLGGSATFSAIAAATLTSDVGVISVAGHDFSDEHKSFFETKGIDMAGVEILPDEKTFAWGGRYEENMNIRHTLYTDLNALAKFSPSVPSHSTQAPFLLLGNVDPALQLQTLDQMQKKLTCVALDTMNLWIEIKPEEVKEVISRIDILVINDEEALMLSKKTSIALAAREILKLGVPYLIIKKGEHGSLLFHQDKVWSIPALLLERIEEPTGAGDCFLGGLMAHLSRSGEVTVSSIKEGILYGTVMASFAVESFSVERLMTATSEEINQRVDTLRQMSL